MIAVVGKPNITLKRIMLEQGFPHLSDFASRGRNPLQQLDGVFNCSYTPAQMDDFVLRRWPYVESDLPIINRGIVPNKLTAQQKMERIIGENILPSSTHGLPENYEGWIIKPYASQGGVGIRNYTGGTVPTGHYIQKNANKLREFRAHVGLWLPDPVFTIQEKKPKPELWEQIFRDIDNRLTTEYHWPVENRGLRGYLPLTWNIESGFYFRRSTTPENRAQKVARFPLFRRIEEVAIKAVRALNYQFGAVDILMDEDRNLWVSEVNSHPAIINPRSKEIYAEVLEPLKTMSKANLYELTNSDTTITRRMVRRATL